MRSRREWTLDCTYVEVDAKASAGIDRKFQKAQDLRRRSCCKTSRRSLSLSLIIFLLVHAALLLNRTFASSKVHFRYMELQRRRETFPISPFGGPQAIQRCSCPVVVFRLAPALIGSPSLEPFARSARKDRLQWRVHRFCCYQLIIATTFNDHLFLLSFGSWNAMLQNEAGPAQLAPNSLTTSRKEHSHFIVEQRCGRHAICCRWWTMAFAPCDFGSYWKLLLCRSVERRTN